MFDKRWRKGLFLLIISLSTLYMKLSFSLEKARPVGLCLCCLLIESFSLWNSQEGATFQMWHYFGCLNFLVAYYLSYTVMCICPENNCHFLVQFHTVTLFLLLRGGWPYMQQAMVFLYFTLSAPVDPKHDFLHIYKFWF